MAWRGAGAAAFLAANALAAALAAAPAAGCASGSDSVPTGSAAAGEPTGGGGNDQSPASSSASGSGAGSGAGDPAGSGGASPTSSTGEGAAAGTGGDGGGTSSAQGGGGQGGNAGQGGGATGTGGGGGAAESGVVALLATGATKVLRGAREGGVWTTTEVAGTFAAASRPAIALRGASAATGLIRSVSSTLLFATWNGNTWSAPAPVGGAITTGDTPAIASSGDGVAHAAFHGQLTDFHYYARHDGGGFSPDDETVSDGLVDAFGPSAAAIAVVDGAPLVAYAGSDGNLYVQERGAADWSTGLDVSGSPPVALTPAVVALAAGADGDALLVFADSESQLHWTRREAGGWVAPEAIDDALSTDAPSLAATADGGGVLAFRGTNGGIYAASFDGDAAAWSAPTRVVPIVTTASTPALATGVGAADAELAYVDAAGAVATVRLVGGAWGQPLVLAQSGFTGVAMTSSP